MNGRSEQHSTFNIQHSTFNLAEGADCARAVGVRRWLLRVDGWLFVVPRRLDLETAGEEA